MNKKALRWVMALALLAVVPVSAQYANLKISKINRPFDIEEAGVGFEPSCDVYNDASYVETCKVTCRIKDLDENEDVYFDAHNNFKANPGTSEATFDEFVPEGGKTYNARFTVESVMSSDSKDKNFSTAGLDVTPFEMLSPSPEEHSTFSPSAIYAERLGLETPNATMICEIADMQETVLYLDSIVRTFAPYDTFTADFSETTLEDNDYIVTFWAESEGLNISHPPLSEPFAYSVIVESDMTETLVLDVLCMNENHTITYILPESGNISLTIYDVAGNLVKIIDSGARDAGIHEIMWNHSGVAAGVYLVRLETEQGNITEKLTVMK